VLWPWGCSTCASRAVLSRRTLRCPDLGCEASCEVRTYFASRYRGSADWHGRILRVTASAAMVARPAEPVAQGSFEVGYVSEDQVEHWAPVVGAWAVSFERCAPVRRFTSKKGQRHLSRLWVISSPTWRRLATGATTQQRTFTTEVGRRLGHPHYQPPGAGDAVAHCMTSDAHGATRSANDQRPKPRAIRPKQPLVRTQPPRRRHHPSPPPHPARPHPRMVNQDGRLRRPDLGQPGNAGHLAEPHTKADSPNTAVQLRPDLAPCWPSRRPMHPRNSRSWRQKSALGIGSCEHRILR
jgi:hypothetical protein